MKGYHKSLDIRIEWKQPVYIIKYNDDKFWIKVYN